METRILDAAALGRQGHHVLNGDGTVSRDPGFQIIEAATASAYVSAFPCMGLRRMQAGRGGFAPGELRRVDLESLARMGNQDLRSHLETSPVADDAARRLPATEETGRGERAVGRTGGRTDGRREAVTEQSFVGYLS